VAGKIQDIREAIATAMATIDGLSTRSTIKDIADIPIAMVGNPAIEYDKAFGRGHDDYDIPVMVLVSRTVDDESQEKLNAYLDPFGTSSIKAAIESDSTLGGVVEDLRVVGTEGRPDMYAVGSVEYLGAVLTVHVMAPGKA
jgi:hypothetical protein